MSLPHEIARINRIDSLTEDAMNQMQITAQTVHQISDLALTPALDRNYLAEIQAADTEHNERERKLKSVERFIQRLPIARGENEYSLGNSYFSNPDLSELRKTEATAWWLGVRQKRDFEFAGFIDLAIKAASPSNYQFMPTYIIGEKQDIPKMAVVMHLQLYFSHPLYQ